MKRIVFHSHALVDIDEPADFYEGRQAGLGPRFLDVIEGCIGRLPYRAYVPFIPRFRSLGIKVTPVTSTTSRWPYRVIFMENDERIFVIAVPHSKRRETYWHSRLIDIDLG